MADPTTGPAVDGLVRRSTAEPVAMRPADAVLWSIEQDPILRSTITAIAVLDRSPSWEGLRAKVRAATDQLPRLRQRVVGPSIPGGLPRWVEDVDFDLDYHLRRVRAPHPGAPRDVLDLATPITMQQLDPTRPLWELTLVEGLEDGGAALIQKLHHSITDGEGAIALAELLLDGDREIGPIATDEPSRPVARRRGQPDLLDVVFEAGDWWIAAVTDAVGASVSLSRAGVRVVLDPVGSTRQARALLGSMAKAVAPVPASASALLQHRGMTRALHTFDLPLAELRSAAHAAGGTTNDAFLAGVVGGLSRYHEHHGRPVESLRLTMPVSVRAEGDDLAANRFAPVRFPVPCTIDDPVARIAAVGAIAHAWEHEPFLAHSDSLATVLAHLPASLTSGILGGMLKHVDVVATNVAGLAEPRYLVGAEVVREYAFAPPAGAAVNVALLSHVDTACIGVVTDAAAVADGDVLLACLVDAFDEVLASSDRTARHAT